MIWISRITTNNFRILKGIHEFDFAAGMAFLVGENNSGKTTLFQAIDFLLSGIPKGKTEREIKNLGAKEGDELSVEMEIKGDIKETIKNFSEAKYEPYVYEVDGVETMKLKRSSVESKVEQGEKKKKVELNVEKIQIFNNLTNQFENPTGKDKTFNLLEIQFIWSDTSPDDVVDFGSTKTCGKLMGQVFSDFRETDKWKDFEKAHEQTFHGEGSLDEKANEVGQEIKEIFSSQYGEVDINFSFPFPDPSGFFKNVDLNVDDGHLTKLDDKGSGMQRGIALAIIQVYAKRLVLHDSDPSQIKPLFFFIDEPEISLHPKAQSILIKALQDISKTQQVFVCTHSPVVMKNFNNDSDSLFLFEIEENGEVSVVDSKNMDTFDWSPSWGEVMFQAFNLATEEHHNELFEELKSRHEKSTGNNVGIKKFDQEFFVATHKENQDSPWETKANQVSRHTHIRNQIHHRADCGTPT